MRIFVVLSVMLSFFCSGYTNEEASFEAKMDQYRECLKAAIEDTCNNFEKISQFSKYQDMKFNKDDAKEFFEELSSNFLNLKETDLEVSIMFYAMKGALSAPNFEKMIKNEYEQALQLREAALKNIFALCDKYFEDENASKIKEKLVDFINNYPVIDVEDLMLVLCGKSLKTEGLEKEALPEFIIENHVKMFLIDEAFDSDCWMFDDLIDCYENILSYSSNKAFLNICKASDSDYLNTIYQKYHNLDGINLDEYMNMDITVLEGFLSSYEDKYYSYDLPEGFIKDLYDIYDDFLCEIDDL